MNAKGKINLIGVMSTIAIMPLKNIPLKERDKYYNWAKRKYSKQTLYFWEKEYFRLLKKHGHARHMFTREARYRWNALISIDLSKIRGVVKYES